MKSPQTEKGQRAPSSQPSSTGQLLKSMGKTSDRRTFTPGELDQFSVDEQISILNTLSAEQIATLNGFTPETIAPLRQMTIKRLTHQKVEVNTNPDERVLLGQKDPVSIKQGEAILFGDSKEKISDLTTINRHGKQVYVAELLSLEQHWQTGEQLLAIFHNLSKMPQGSRVRLIIGDLQEWNIAVDELLTPPPSPSSSLSSSPTSQNTSPIATLRESKLSLKSPTATELQEETQYDIQRPSSSPRTEKQKLHFEQFAKSLRPRAKQKVLEFVRNTHFQFGLFLLKQAGIEFYIDLLSNHTPGSDDTEKVDHIKNLLEENECYRGKFDETISDHEASKKEECRSNGTSFKKTLINTGSYYYKFYELVYLLNLFQKSADQISDINSKGIKLKTAIEDDYAFDCYTYTFKDTAAHPDATLWQKLWEDVGCSDMPYLRTRHTKSTYTMETYESPQSSPDTHKKKTPNLKKKRNSANSAGNQLSQPSKEIDILQIIGFFPTTGKGDDSSQDTIEDITALLKGKQLTETQKLQIAQFVKLKCAQHSLMGQAYKEMSEAAGVHSAILGLQILAANTPGSRKNSGDPALEPESTEFLPTTQPKAMKLSVGGAE